MGIITDNGKPRDVEAIAYEDDFPFPYNNFVYVVHVDLGPSHATKPAQRQPGTHPIPTDIDTFIIRLPNPLSGYNDRIRVENEVAALSLARDALQANFPAFVPRVFGWGSGQLGQGWILEEYMAGSPLLDDFGKMTDEDKANILGQMADVLSTLQRYQLPSTVRDFGGLGFGPSGEYTSAPLSILNAGPFATYEDLVKATIQSKLVKADSDPQVLGWQANGIRARLDKFIADGLHPALSDLGDYPKVLVHADLSTPRCSWPQIGLNFIKIADFPKATDNFLYDRSTKKLTALIDFDFAHVATFADEFFRSLGADIGQFPSAREGGESLALHRAMLCGFPDPLPPPTEEVQWSSAKAWDDALRERGAVRPSTIKNIAGLSDLFWLSGQILPFKLCNEVVVMNSTEVQLGHRKEAGEERLTGFLHDHGY